MICREQPDGRQKNYWPTGANTTNTTITANPAITYYLRSHDNRTD